jgi:hypothetical protein
MRSRLQQNAKTSDTKHMRDKPRMNIVGNMGARTRVAETQINGIVKMLPRSSVLSLSFSKSIQSAR